MLPRLSFIGIVLYLSAACASLEGLRAFVQAPRFSQAEGRPSEIRLTGPTASAPGGGAAIRLWTRVSNPNSFGLTLGTLRGTLYLEGSRAATADFPLGLPLPARGDEVVPLDIEVSFRDLQSLGQAITRAVSRQPIEYELEGTIGVSAGALGEPVFGPMTILRGELRR
jgi:Late embryogenesis abundant protein